MISAYEHGWNAARLGKHICPFDSGTAEWQEWRDGFLLPAGQCMQEASPIARGAPRTADDSVVADTMKFIGSLVANTTTSLQRDVGDGKESSSDLGVAGLPKRTLRKQSPGRIICARSVPPCRG